MASVAYEMLTRAIAAADGPGSVVATAARGSRKGLASVAWYAVAVALAYVNRGVSVCIYVFVILLWLIPDGRMVRDLAPVRRGSDA